MTTLDALRTARVPSLAVISKADLLSSHDLDRLVAYAKEKLALQLGMSIPVSPLSARPEFSHLLVEWIDREIAPRAAKASLLARESNVRKSLAVAQNLLHALKLLRRKMPDPASAPVLQSAAEQLRHAANLLESCRSEGYQLIRGVRDGASDAIHYLATQALGMWRNSPSTIQLDETWIEQTCTATLRSKADQLSALLRSLAQQLAASVNAASSAIAAGDNGNEISFESLVKDQPAPQFIICPAQLKRPSILSFSKAMRLSNLKSQLQSQCASHITHVFDSYGRALELWFNTVVSRLEYDFNSSAEIYRSQIQLARSGASPASTSDESLSRDIALLEGLLKSPSPVEVNFG